MMMEHGRCDTPVLDTLVFFSLSLRSFDLSHRATVPGEMYMLQKHLVNVSQLKLESFIEMKMHIAVQSIRQTDERTKKKQANIDRYFSELVSDCYRNDLLLLVECDEMFHFKSEFDWHRYRRSHQCEIRIG